MPAMEPAPRLSGGDGGKADGAAKLILAITALLVVLGLVAFFVVRYLEPAREAMVAPTESTSSTQTTQVPAPPDTAVAPETVVSTVIVTAPPTAPPTTRPPTTTAPNSAVTSLRAGSWIMILDSLPKNEFTIQQAEQRAAGMRTGGRPVVSVIDSDAIPGLNGGYWALGVPGHSSRDSAANQCAMFNREVGGDCYPRQVE